MRQFEVLDISGDVGIRAFGTSKEELFIHALCGMYSLITDPGSVREKRSLEITLERGSVEDLLVSWLNEMVFHFDTSGFIGTNIELIDFSEKKIRAVLSGEDFDPGRHEGRLLIKAATYHKLRIEKVRGIWEADIIFDI
jgi:SHS2 domain-containing protein